MQGFDSTQLLFSKYLKLDWVISGFKSFVLIFIHTIFKLFVFPIFAVHLVQKSHNNSVESPYH